MQNFLKSFQLLSNEEIAHIAQHTTTRTLKKGGFFIREGAVCQEVAFIKSGILRSYYTKENGEEITYCITFQDSLMTAYSSFITGQPSPESIQALTKTELSILPKSYLEKQSKISTNWLALQKFFAEQQYVALEKRIFSYQKERASERYQALLENYPSYVQKIPLQYLASYLGITPRHLSRIRREVVL